MLVALSSVIKDLTGTGSSASQTAHSLLAEDLSSMPQRSLHRLFEGVPNMATGFLPGKCPKKAEGWELLIIYLALEASPLSYPVFLISQTIPVRKSDH